MLKTLRKITPPFLILGYHWLLAWGANMRYGWPGKELVVIGVTGTNGKTTTANLIAHLLGELGFKVGLSSTLFFSEGEGVYPNQTKSGMLGRGKLVAKLRQMVNNGCQYAVLETTSEGISQFRHFGLAYDLAVVTNLTPEHLESHGSFAAYRAAKLKLIKAVIANKKGRRLLVLNVDDPQAGYFLKSGLKKVLGFGFADSLNSKLVQLCQQQALDCRYQPLTKVKFLNKVTSFRWQGIDWQSSLPGKYNLANLGAALTAIEALGLPVSDLNKSLKKLPQLPGRFEVVRSRSGKLAVVDYAHDAAALEKLYQTVRQNYPQAKIIAVLGSAGGGRDIQKRPIMAQVVAKYATKIILTQEDDYDEDPLKIIADLEGGLVELGQKKGVDYEIKVDRGLAIERAVSLASNNDVIVLSGKGAETVMIGPGGKNIPHDDRLVVKSV